VAAVLDAQMYGSVRRSISSLICRMRSSARRSVGRSAASLAAAPLSTPRASIELTSSKSGRNRALPPNDRKEAEENDETDQRKSQPRALHGEKKAL
jgi:hypothetical protein